MEKYDIYDALVPFEDAEDEKERPVLIVTELKTEVVALKISSKPRSSLTQFRISEWEQAGLREESYIYYSPVYRINKKDLGEYRGRLRLADIFRLEIILVNGQE